MSRTVPLKLCSVLFALSACSGDMSIEDARQAAVVTVGGVELDGATLERVLMAAPPQSPGPTRETASVVISAFIDAALLRHAMVRGDSLNDSVRVLEAITPDAIRGQIMELLERRAAAMPQPTDEQADSLGRLGGVRTFQHILVRVADPRDSVETAAAVVRIRSIEAELARPGASFDDVARRMSDDSATAPNGGYLPPLRQRDIPAEAGFADRVWALSPGDVSRPLVSRSGVHIVRRTTLVEGRPGFKQALLPILTRRADSLWVDSLSTARSLTLANNAVSRMRELAVEPFSAGGNEPFATWQGGELTADEVRMWISVLPIAERVALPTAADSALTLFVEQLAERDIVAEQATGAERVTARAWGALAPQFRAALTSVGEQYRDALVIGDSTTAVRGFLVEVSTGQRPYRPLPGGLAGMLRRDAPVELNQRAIDAIVLEAGRQWRLQRGTDSTTSAAPPSAAATDTATPAIP
jgi:hypothetical protein